ncbi:MULTISPECIES: PspC domain-containing protein [Aeromonas]|jgi:phage shock protein C|uniref:PspC domain-containing protein n=4 Tax=Gammaproteobacteria TaxID=1236 RepID=A0A3L0VSX9_ECOLX|nr:MULTISPECIES: PspC domain-containing protein [Aeromonas]ATP08109.1 PspC domain protein [Aeromonas salmonicida subsp. pectinolytica 34mel]EQC04206.1 phage shock protein C [Aeromonas salmonicida subsp. pectinolytica 34mel]KTA76853.1 phage-shock protein [Aeromonas salmonicida]KTA84302.1 phage-shock protein [Aeromonas salmonicida]MBP6140735.1 PspC domain-containing protein [Aeromonas sp.]
MTPWPKDLAHRKLTGVCAGIASRLGLSRVTVRIVALIALILMPPLTLAAYLLAVLIMPPRRELKRWLD